jgi:hypothetical protein
MMRAMRGKWLPVALMAAFAVSRVPGVLPENFSAAYAMAFCAGVFFPGAMAWWLPLGTLLFTDLALNLYYWLDLGWDVWQRPALVSQFFNYVAFAALVGLGRGFRPHARLLPLLGGGVLGALLFYLITNTASWFFNPFHNPEYTKTLAGWLTALTRGTAGWPQTWEFFRNTLLSGGLFTALFAVAYQWTASAESPAEKHAGAREPEAEGETKPEVEESRA